MDTKNLPLATHNACSCGVLKWPIPNSNTGPSVTAMHASKAGRCDPHSVAVFICGGIVTRASLLLLQEWVGSSKIPQSPCVCLRGFRHDSSKHVFCPLDMEAFPYQTNGTFPACACKRRKPSP